MSKPFSDLVKWRWAAWRSGVPKPPSTSVDGYAGFERVQTDTARLSANRSEPTVTWIGHATTLVQLAGFNILTDPQFSQRASPVSFLGPQRRVPLTVTLSDLPRIDVVVISHNHYDHLDRATVIELAGQPGRSPLFLVPLGLDDWFRNQGITNVRAMDWWDHHRVGFGREVAAGGTRDDAGQVVADKAIANDGAVPTGQADARELDVTFVPVQHWSARGLGDRNETLWGGWVLSTASTRVFFAGDTGYSSDFAEIGRRFDGFDLALIPVGAYEPRWFMREQHVDPEEAVKIHLDLHARRSIGVHWSTFELTDEPLDQPIDDLARALAKYSVKPGEFMLLRHGETLDIGR